MNRDFFSPSSRIFLHDFLSGVLPVTLLLRQTGNDCLPHTDDNPASVVALSQMPRVVALIVNKSR